MRQFRKIMILFSCALLANMARAQGEWPDYYTGKTLVNGEKATYEVVPYILEGQTYDYTIYNMKNKWRGEIPTFKDGTPIKTPYQHWDYWMENPKIDMEAILHSFTPEEINILVQKKANLSITKIIDTQGYITDVVFHISPGDSGLGIHPDKLNSIEEYIKKYDKYRVEGNAKELTFMRSTGTIMFERFYINLNRE